MEKPETISVRVAGRLYKLRSTLDKGTIDRAVGYINRRLQEVHAISASMDSETAAIAVALSLAGELVQAQDDNLRLHKALHEANEQSN